MQQLRKYFTMVLAIFSVFIGQFPTPVIATEQSTEFYEITEKNIKDTRIDSSYVFSWAEVGDFTYDIPDSEFIIVDESYDELYIDLYDEGIERAKDSISVQYMDVGIYQGQYIHLRVTVQDFINVYNVDQDGVQLAFDEFLPAIEFYGAQAIQLQFAFVNDDGDIVNIPSFFTVEAESSSVVQSGILSGIQPQEGIDSVYYYNDDYSTSELVKESLSQKQAVGYDAYTYGYGTLGTMTSKIGTFTMTLNNALNKTEDEFNKLYTKACGPRMITSCEEYPQEVYYQFLPTSYLGFTSPTIHKETSSQLAYGAPFTYTLTTRVPSLYRAPEPSMLLASTEEETDYKEYGSIIITDTIPQELDIQEVRVYSRILEQEEITDKTEVKIKDNQVEIELLSEKPEYPEDLHYPSKSDYDTEEAYKQALNEYYEKRDAFYDQRDAFYDQRDAYYDRLDLLSNADIQIQIDVAPKQDSTLWSTTKIQENGHLLSNQAQCTTNNGTTKSNQVDTLFVADLKVKVINGQIQEVLSMAEETTPVSGENGFTVYTLPYQEDATVQFAPDLPSYRLKSITVNGELIDISQNPTEYTFSNLTGTDNTLVVEYEKRYQIETKIRNQRGGTITQSIYELEEGTTSVIDYQPDEGYQVLSLTVDGEEKDINEYPNQYIFENIQTNHTIEVAFQPLKTSPVTPDTDDEEKPKDTTKEEIKTPSKIQTGIANDSALWFCGGVLALVVVLLLLVALWKFTEE